MKITVGTTVQITMSKAFFLASAERTMEVPINKFISKT